MSPVLVLLINLAALLLVAIALRGFVIRQTRQDALFEEIKREAGAIVTELNSTTERNIELLEEKIATLSELIATADRSVGALRRESASNRVSGQTYTHLGARRQPPPSVLPADAKVGQPKEEEQESEPAVAAPTIRDRVIALADRGFTSSQIASSVGKTVGEVELIISLTRS